MLNRKWLLTGLAGTFLSLVLAGTIFLTGKFAGSSEVAKSTPAQTDLRNYFLYGMDGESHAIGEFLGMPVVVNFWATWCKPCEQEMPLLQSYSEKFGSIKVVGINSGEDPDTIEPFLSKYDITFPVWLDSEEKLTEEMKIFGLPTTYFVDSNGEILATHLGQLTPDLMDQYLLRLGVEK